MTRSNLLWAPALAMMIVGCAGAASQAETPPSATASMPQANDDLAAFPAAAEGQTRHVLRLPAEADEDAARIEIIVGQTVTVDCNHHGFTGALETHTAQGWGYDYYVLPALGPRTSTLMGCPPGSDREAFVAVQPQPLVRYNSRLPLVVYAPSDAEVRYRVWRAGEARPLR